MKKVIGLSGVIQIEALKIRVYRRDIITLYLVLLFRNFLMIIRIFLYTMHLDKKIEYNGHLTSNNLII